jgi:hypothetical protein
MHSLKTVFIRGVQNVDIRHLLQALGTVGGYSGMSHEEYPKETFPWRSRQICCLEIPKEESPVFLMPFRDQFQAVC